LGNIGILLRGQLLHIKYDKLGKSGRDIIEHSEQVRSTSWVDAAIDVSNGHLEQYNLFKLGKNGIDVKRVQSEQFKLTKLDR